ncbi:hypothetical protein [Paenibacillus sp. MBLB4367]|uniref:hypothetical protein n=1 Tax=Paenibacillus sp. MBLB4367 TaxID=3384767 RepID=UPI003908096E
MSTFSKTSVTAEDFRRYYFSAETEFDLEGTFVFLASLDSDFITGQTLNFDGGRMLH